MFNLRLRKKYRKTCFTTIFARTFVDLIQIFLHLKGHEDLIYIPIHGTVHFIFFLVSGDLRIHAAETMKKKYPQCYSGKGRKDTVGNQTWYLEMEFKLRSLL